MAVTKKCPLSCEHCFEWDELNRKEKLSLQNIKDMVSIFQGIGTSQIQITGGEPTTRIHDLVEVLKISNNSSEFWLLSSGFHLTPENTQKLKVAGLTGVVISLDHFDEKTHNTFRGHADSFRWVQEAVVNALSSNLVVALSICVTRAFISEHNLMTYAKLAKKMGVSFIQILEPKAVGHYRGKDVLLLDEQKEMLRNFYWKMNFNKEFRDFPIISYHGNYQQTAGCFAAANRTLYVDTNGDFQACPFCQSKSGNVLSGDTDAILANMLASGCSTYRTAKY